MARLAPARQGRFTILIHEWVTGGGLAGQSLPPSWAAEGQAMRRALARDFAALPGARVVATLDERFAEERGPWSAVPVGPGEEVAALSRLAAAADYTVLIAPEMGGILADRTRLIDGCGGRGLGSSPEAIERTADKLRLGADLARQGIPTPLCRRVVPRDGLPLDFPYPAVLKPVDGAGAQDTFLISEPGACPEAAWSLPVAVLQPLVPGAARSASFLVGCEGRARLVAAGCQHAEIRAGRFVYRGGTLPAPPEGIDAGLRRAVESVPGLRGFVGVDYLWDDRAGCAVVLEINPRPTTSVVGLTRLLAPGRLASTWLDIDSGAWSGSALDGLFPELDPRKPVTFAVDGGMMEAALGPGSNDE